MIENINLDYIITAYMKINDTTDLRHHGVKEIFRLSFTTLIPYRMVCEKHIVRLDK